MAGGRGGRDHHCLKVPFFIYWSFWGGLFLTQVFSNKALTVVGEANDQHTYYHQFKTSLRKILSNLFGYFKLKKYIYPVRQFTFGDQAHYFRVSAFTTELFFEFRAF